MRYHILFFVIFDIKHSLYLEHSFGTVFHMLSLRATTGQGQSVGLQELSFPVWVYRTALSETSPGLLLG